MNTEELLGVDTGTLSREEAQRVYDEIVAILPAIDADTEAYEELYDIADTLAWAIDPVLRKFCEDAVAEIESRQPLTLSNERQTPATG